ncbi:MAG: RelA/SpoT family protein [Hyphomicrobiaceae bacterium]
MMRQYELVERVLKYEPNADEALLNRAYVYAMKAHGHQTRASGDPYFSHPLEVAAILTELEMDDATIVAALLHDVIEDTDVTKVEIDKLFGTEIGSLVDGLTKINRLDLVSRKAKQAENFRKLLLAISTDIRVLLVKLADRLHNMRTMEHMKSASRQRISEETLEIYAPLAGRMGMQSMRDELETLSFQWLHPRAFSAVSEKLSELRQKNKGLVEEIRATLDTELRKAGINATVSGRHKKPYSIWRKMENRQIGLEQLSDIFGFRAIVDTKDECYRVLGLAHTQWRAVPGRFKDYISTPKQNNYRSIHTTIVGPRHQRVELQIRTHEMHNIAEYGVAAHALYKDFNTVTNKKTTSDPSVDAAKVSHKDSGPYAWLRRLVETMLEGSDSEEFLENTKLELFQDQVFCFTPKGRLIALPRGATPLDFAYAVHTDVGHQAVGAFINGRHVPINTRLRNGDEVEIQITKNHTPPIAWEGFAVTGRARSAIRRAGRIAIRNQYAELGRRFMMAAAEANVLDYSDEKLEQALPRLASQQKTIDDILAAVGRNEMGTRDVLMAMHPTAKIADTSTSRSKPKNRHGQQVDQDGWFNLAQGFGLRFRLTDEVVAMWGEANVRDDHVDETNDRCENEDQKGSANFAGANFPVTLSEGAAIPGDRIVGVLTPGKGINVYPIHAPQLGDYENQQWIDAAWDIDPNRPQRFLARLGIIAVNEPGSLAVIAQSIGENDGNIDQLKMVHRGADFTDMQIEIEVWDLSHLNHIVSALKEKAVVSTVERVFDS